MTGASAQKCLSPETHNKAVEWFRKLAVRGNSRGQLSLQECYQWAEGVPKNYIYASVWLNISAAQENLDARLNLPHLEKQMTPLQVAEAQKLRVTYSELIKQGKTLPAQ